MQDGDQAELPQWMKIKFSQHAIKRAKERRLWQYVNKKLFYYEAEHLSPQRARLDNCIYVYSHEDGYDKILTMYGTQNH